MLDADIRPRAIAALRHSYPGAFIVPEVTLAYIRVRADLVAVTESQMHCIEIKSDGDVLGPRWDRQFKGYERVFDSTTLVSTVKHAAKALPFTARHLARGLTIVTDHRPFLIPCFLTPSETVEAEQWVRLLWRDELYQITKRLKLGPNLHAGKSHLQALLLTQPFHSLRPIVCRALRLRDWESSRERTRQANASYRRAMAERDNAVGPGEN